MASRASTDIEQRETKTSQTINSKPTDTEECEAEAKSTSSSVSEPQRAPASQQIGALGDHLVEQNTQKPSHSPIITLAGRSGVGKSTMINNFLGLEGDQKCATGDDADPTTTGVKVCSNTKDDTEIKIVDTPGLGGLKRSEVKKFSKTSPRLLKKLLTFSCTASVSIPLEESVQPMPRLSICSPQPTVQKSGLAQSLP